MRRRSARRPPRVGLVLATIGDLVEDVVVRLDGAVNVASDTSSTIERRQGGSAANVAVAAARLGAPVRFIGQVGDDAAGRALVEELGAAGVDVGAIRFGGTTGTIVVLVDRRRRALDADRPRRGVRTRRARPGLARRRARAPRPALLADRAAALHDGGATGRLGARAGSRRVDRSLVDGGDHRARRRTGSPRSRRPTARGRLRQRRRGGRARHRRPGRLRDDRRQARSGAGRRAPRRRAGSRSPSNRSGRSPTRPAPATRSPRASSRSAPTRRRGPPIRPAR